MLSLYFLVIVISMVINGFGRFNSVPVLFFCLVWLIYIKDINYYLWVLFLSSIISFFSLSNGVSILHIFLDILDLAFVLGTIFLCDKFYFSKRAITSSLIFIALLLVLSVFCMKFQGLYEYSDGEYRYNGIISKGNSSSNTFLVLSMFFWELFKRIKKNGVLSRFILMIILCMFLAYVFTSQTRSMLIALPYWLYQFALLYGKKTIIIISTIIGLFASAYLVIILQEKLRMTEDASFLTRVQLYQAEIEGIMQNYFVIPHGSHKAWELAIDVTWNDKFSPHNDFLKFLYDWGIAFILLIILFFKRVRKKVGFDLNICLLLLAQSSCMLHNMWFLPIVWLPILFILNLKKSIPYEKDVSSSKKIQ